MNVATGCSCEIAVFWCLAPRPRRDPASSSAKFKIALDFQKRALKNNFLTKRIVSDIICFSRIGQSQSPSLKKRQGSNLASFHHQNKVISSTIHYSLKIVILVIY